MVELWNKFEYIWYFDGTKSTIPSLDNAFSPIWVEIVVDINNLMFRYYFLVHFKTDPRLIFRYSHICLTGWNLSYNSKSSFLEQILMF